MSDNDVVERMLEAYNGGSENEHEAMEAAARVLLEDLYQWHPWIASDYAISLGIRLSEQPADSEPQQDAPAAGAEQPVPEGHG